MIHILLLPFHKRHSVGQSLFFVAAQITKYLGYTRAKKKKMVNAQLLKKLCQSLLVHRRVNMRTIILFCFTLLLATYMTAAARPVKVDWFSANCDLGLTTTPSSSEILPVAVGNQSTCHTLADNTSLSWTCTANATLTIQKWQSLTCDGPGQSLEYLTNECINIVDGSYASSIGGVSSRAYYCDQNEVGHPTIGPGVNASRTSSDTPTIYNESIVSCNITNCLNALWVISLYDNDACDGLPFNVSEIQNVNFGQVYRVGPQSISDYNVIVDCVNGNIVLDYAADPEGFHIWSRTATIGAYCQQRSPGVYFTNHCRRDSSTPFMLPSFASRVLPLMYLVALTLFVTVMCH